MPVWFVIAVGSRTVVYRFRNAFPGYVDIQKRLFRENGTPVLAVIRLRPREGGDDALFKRLNAAYEKLVPKVPPS